MGMLTRLLLFLGILAAMLVVAATTAGARPTSVAACNPGRLQSFNTYHDGWAQPSDGGVVGGVYSLIENEEPYVAPYSLATTGWVMLAKYQAAKWSQVGWYWTGTASHTFLQVWDGTTDVTRTTDPPTAFPGSTYYTALYDPATSRFTFQVGGLAWPYSGYYVQQSWSPNEGEIFGEIQNYDSQMPGTVSNPMDTSDAHYYHYGYWTEFAGTPYSDNSSLWPYASGGSPLTHLAVWDSGCA